MYLCVVYVLGACRVGMRRPCVEDICVCVQVPGCQGQSVGHTEAVMFCVFPCVCRVVGARLYGPLRGPSRGSHIYVYFYA